MIAVALLLFGDQRSEPNQANVIAIILKPAASIEMQLKCNELCQFIRSA